SRQRVPERGSGCSRSPLSRSPVLEHHRHMRERGQEGWGPDLQSPPPGGPGSIAAAAHMINLEESLMSTRALKLAAEAVANEDAAGRAALKAAADHVNDSKSIGAALRAAAQDVKQVNEAPEQDERDW
ncbi:unnamed protein product, partial [Chrysoparadoxa australica]